MWRYYELLTDVQVAEIEKMKREAHPMQAKKDLARRIVADFHSAEAGVKAGEDWAKQFQQDEVPEDVVQISVQLSEVGGAVDASGNLVLRVDRLLVKCGLAESTTDAGRKLKQGSVKIDDVVHKEPRLVVNGPSPRRLTLRGGKQLRVAEVSW